MPEEAFGAPKAEPDVFLFDGMGTAHSRRIGGHIGPWLQRPSVGVARRACAETHAALPEEVGAQVLPLERGDTIGVSLRTPPPSTHCSCPVASRLHRERRRTGVRLHATIRLPEPTRLAHRAAGAS